MHPVCSNPKCISNKDVLETDFSPYWFALETIFNILFTIELIVKLIVYPDLSQWFLGADAMVNFIDVIAILPYYVEAITKFSQTGVRQLLAFL